MDELLAELRGPCNGALPSVERKPYFAMLTFPPAPGAEYAFYGCVHDDDTLELGARPLEGPAEALFWGRKLEPIDYGSYETMLARFKRELLAVLTNDTVIVQLKGWLCWSFVCEVLSESETIRLHGASTLRPARAPVCRGRRRTYRSPAVCSRRNGRLDG